MRISAVVSLSLSKMHKRYGKLKFLCHRKLENNMIKHYIVLNLFICYANSMLYEKLVITEKFPSMTSCQFRDVVIRFDDVFLQNGNPERQFLSVVTAYIESNRVTNTCCNMCER